MRNAGKMAVLCVAAFSLSITSGCKKKFDPNDFEGGAAASASAAASATTPPIDSSAATTTDDAGDGLAPLETGKTHVAATTGGGGGGAAKPKGDPPECVQARQVCNAVPSADRRKAAENEKNCNQARFACFNKGGHL